MRISDWSSDVCSSDLLTARSFLTQQVSEGRELMHAHQSWRVEADAPFLEGYLFRAGRLVEEGHGSPVATPAAGDLHFRPFLDQMIIAPPIGHKITDRPALPPVLLRAGDQSIHSPHRAVILTRKRDVEGNGDDHASQLCGG